MKQRANLRRNAAAVARLSALLLLLVAAVAPAGAGVALAHAHYDHSQPAIGQVLASAPARVDIYTDSDMRKLAGNNVITVTGPDGSRVDDGNTVLDDSNRQHFSVGLAPNLPSGRYVVSFETLSDADGDTDHGRFAFYIGGTPTAAQQAQDAQLNGAVPTVATTPDATSGSSHTGVALYAAIGVAALIVLLALGGFLLRGRRGTQP